MDSSFKPNVETPEASPPESGKPYRKFHRTNSLPNVGGYSVKRPRSYDMTLLTSDHVEFQIQPDTLSAVSDYFSALLSSGMNEQLEQRVQFSDIDSATLEPFLKFACTGDVTVGEDSFLPLLQLGCRFQCQRLLDILAVYAKQQFLHLKQEDVSFVVTSRIHPQIADICNRLIRECLIRENMLQLSFEVIEAVLKDDDLICACEDDVLRYVKSYCSHWDLDAQQRVGLLNKVRTPRLTTTAFDEATGTVAGFKDTESYQKIVDRAEFVQRVKPDQLRARVAHDVYVTMFWVGEQQKSPFGVFSIVDTLRLGAETRTRSISRKRIRRGDRGFQRLSDQNFFSSGPYVSYANHLFRTASFGFTEKLTFDSDATYFNLKINSDRQNEQLSSIEHVIGVDYELESFYLSCLKDHGAESGCVVLHCHIRPEDKWQTKLVPIPACVSRTVGRRMIYRKDAICILTFESELFVYTADCGDQLYRVPPADSFKPRYIQIAAQDDLLYVFDYAQCPIESHDFSQPFSRFDKVRVFSLLRKQWVASYSADLNSLRLSGYNELIDFNVEMYFIRKRFYFSWTYQCRLHVFRLDESAGCVSHLVNYKVPRDAVGLILLPSYYLSHSNTTVLEKFMQNKCRKNSHALGSDPVEARTIAQWRETILDGVIGSGLFRNGLIDTAA